MDIARTLTWTAERHPQRRAVGGPRPMTYRQWDAHTNRLARSLADLGVRAQDRVAFVMSNGEPLASLHLAAQKLGAVSVPLSIRFGPEEMAHCLRDCAPRLLVTDAATAAQAERALALVPEPFRRAHSGAPGDAPAGADPLDRLAESLPDGPFPHRPGDRDLSVMLYTSGTTGRPKGVPRTHAAEHMAALAHLVQARHGPGEVSLGVMPLFHTMGIRTLLAGIAGGGTWVPQERFDAERSLELIAGAGVTALYLVPTIYWSLLRTGRLEEATSVRRLGAAGAPMTPALTSGLAEVVRPETFVNHFGSTEIFTFTVEQDAAAKPGSAGRAGLFSNVRLVASDASASPGDLVGPGEQGQVLVSMDSPEAFTGYWNRADADARAIRDGWYYTGDLAVADEDGDLWYRGRMDDMINSGGEKIYPGDIEAALARCPAVSDVVVAGLPDDKWGQAVTAFIIPRSGMDPRLALRAVEAFIDGCELPSLKRPKRVIVVPRIPKSAVGKILRRELVGGTYRPLAESQIPSVAAGITT